MHVSRGVNDANLAPAVDEACTRIAERVNDRGLNAPRRERPIVNEPDKPAPGISQGARVFRLELLTKRFAIDPIPQSSIN
eukprot:scaffold30403_cov65-Phaeocystis_antarctica.AAC.2